MTIRRQFLAAAACALLPLAALTAEPAAINVAGTWTTSFDSQVGVQTYTYTFVVKGTELTGTFKLENGEGPITEGNVDKGVVTFVENMSYQGMELRIAYTGTVVSADEIKFKRDVGGQGGEEFTAKRKK
jgi:hypothetical protein